MRLMKLITCLSLFSAGLLAQPVLTNLPTYNSSYSLYMQVNNTNDPKAGRIYYTEKSGSCPADWTGMPFGSSLKVMAATSSLFLFQIDLTGLKPTTTYCMQACWRSVGLPDACNPTIDELSSVVEATTPVETTPEISKPILPDESLFRITPPIADAEWGTTITNCLASGAGSWVTVVAAARAQADIDGLSRSVKMQADLDCGYNVLLSTWLPASTGVLKPLIIIHPTTPDSELPPIGTRVGPEWLFTSGGVRKMPRLRIQGTLGKFMSATNADNYYIYGFEFSQGEAAAEPKDCTDCRTVSNATATTPITITFTTATPVWANNVVCLKGVRGVAGVNDDPAKPNCYLYTTNGADPVNSIDLTGTAGTGTYTGGGVGTNLPKIDAIIVDLVNAGDRITFDRNVFNARGFPFRIGYAFRVVTAHTAIVNNHFTEFTAWNPLVGDITYGSNTQLAHIVFGGSNGMLVQNNYIECAGICVYHENASSTSQIIPNMSNYIVRRNTFFLPDRWRTCDVAANNPGGPLPPIPCLTPNPATDNLMHFHRQSVEFKAGLKVLLDGNTCHGSWSALALPGQCFNFPWANNGNALNDPPLSMSDLTITNNSAWNTVGLLHLACGAPQGSSVGAEGQRWAVVSTNRILVSNNFAWGMKHYRDRTGGDASGRAMSIGGACINVIVEHNTFFDHHGSFPSNFVWAGQRATRQNITNNIMTWNQNATLGGMTVDPVNAIPAFSPGQWTPANAFPQMFGSSPLGLLARGDVSDTESSRIQFNFFIPGIRTALNFTASDYTSTNTAINLNKFSLCDSTVGVLKDYLAFGNTCIGNNNANTGTETANNRYDLAAFYNASPDKSNTDATIYTFAAPTNINFRLKSTSVIKNRASDGTDPGVDHDQLDSAQGVVKNNRVLSVTSTTATIAFTAPAGDTCTVEWNTNATFGGAGSTRLTSASGDTRNLYTPRTVALTSLPAGSQIFSRTFCPSQIKILTFTTAP